MCSLYLQKTFNFSVDSTFFFEKVQGKSNGTLTMEPINYWAHYNECISAWINPKNKTLEPPELWQEPRLTSVLGQLLPPDAIPDSIPHPLYSTPRSGLKPMKFSQKRPGLLVSQPLKGL